MGEDLREVLLSSYPEMSEALVVQSVLEAGGVPCRVGDLAQLPVHALGFLGTKGRAAGVWILEVNLERATELLGTAGVSEGGVDEEAVAAEALAAAPPEGEEPAPAQPWPGPAPGVRAGAPSRVALVALAGFILFGGVVLARGCH